MGRTWLGVDAKGAYGLLLLAACSAGCASEGGDVAEGEQLEEQEHGRGGWRDRTKRDDEDDKRADGGAQTGRGQDGGAHTGGAHDGGTPSGRPTAPGSALPTEVCKVMQDNGCLTCHQGHGHGGAPMGLALAGDFAARALDGSPMGAKVLARMRDQARPMPPSSSGRPLASAADLAVLERWFESGAKGVDGPACTASAAAAPTGPAWARTPWPAEQCEYVLTVGAHERSGTPLANDPAGFAVPPEETYYHCFYEKVPWGDKPVQALAVRARIEGPDDQQLVHHMQLSSLGPNDSTSLLGGARPTVGGQHHPCGNPNGSTIGTWAPGALNPVTLPSDTGVLMPSGANAFVELQVHYHNPKHLSGKRSRTSFDICVTTKKRPNTAGVHTLGYENAVWLGLATLITPDAKPTLDNKGNGVGTGVCTAKQRTRVLSIAPHMHELGRHAKVEILRKDGRVQVIHDKPFRFDEQTSYLYDDLWIEPGEKVRTTCTWDTSRKIVFGFASQDEMCFFSTLSYPAGALAGLGAEKGLAGGDLSCAGTAD